MAVPIKDKIFVLLQFLLFIVYLFDWSYLEFSSPRFLVIFAGILVVAGGLLALVALFQLNDKISPFPSPKQNSELRTSAAFSISRHPIYTGIILVAIGVAVYLGSGYKIFVSIVLFALFFLKSQYEEQKLIEMFPDYKLYRTKTGRFFPKIGSKKK